MRFLPESEDVSAAVIGLGYVGSCVAGALAERGVRVVGVDTDARLTRELAERHCRFSEPGPPELLFSGLDSEALRVTTDYAEIAGVDVVIVAVGTPIREGGVLEDTQLRAACENLSGHLREGQLVLLKSTVPPGMNRELVVPLLERSGLTCGVDFGLAFCPERLSEGTALRELRSFPIVVGG